MVCSYCRTALQLGSRFCNSCGTPIAAPAHPAAQPTQQWQQQPAQPTQQWQNPSVGAAQQTVAWDPAQVNGQYAGAAAAPAKKPWLILSLLLALIAGAVGVAAVAITRGGKPLTSQTQNPVSPGSGVVQNVNPGMPQGPNAVNSQTGLPSSGNPVTASTKGKDDMAPSVMMSQGGNPNAPSVTGAQQPRVPTAPSMTGQSQPLKQSAPMVAQTQVPNGPDPVFDRYLQWLMFVEGQRSQLEEAAVNRGANQMGELMGAVNDLMSDDPQANLKAEQFPQRKMAEAAKYLRLEEEFWNNITKSKPGVPEDCKWLDGYYMAARDFEIQTSKTLQVAMLRGDMGKIQTAKSQKRLIYQNLKKADEELRKVLDIRRYPQNWVIKYEEPSLSVPGL